MADLDELIDRMSERSFTLYRLADDELNMGQDLLSVKNAALNLIKSTLLDESVASEIEIQSQGVFYTITTQPDGTIIETKKIEPWETYAIVKASFRTLQ